MPNKRRVKIKGRSEIIVKFNKRGGVEEGVGISRYPLISVTNEKRDKCLMLMLNLKVSKQARSEASKNNVMKEYNQKSIKHINKPSKSK